MSDDFNKVAMREISEELKENSKILNQCKSDKDVGENATKIRKHLHKIKGIAPMANFNSVGELASLNDQLLKKVLEGKRIVDIYEIINESNFLMIKLLEGPSLKTDNLTQRIKTKYSAFLD